MTRGEMIRAARESRGLSQATVAAAAKIAQQSYSDIEADITKSPRRVILERISKMLDIPFESLLLGDDWREPIPEEARVIAREYATCPDDIKNKILMLIVEAKTRASHPQKTPIAA